jgi:cytochrome c oxidase assembly protein subunit 15
MAVRLWRLKSVPVVRSAIITMLVILFAQIALGLSNVILLVPLAVAVAHNAVGALLLLSMVNINFQLHRLQK